MNQTFFLPMMGLLTIAYLYQTFALLSICEGMGKNIGYLFLCGTLTTIGFLWPSFYWIICVGIVVVTFLFAIFYSDRQVRTFVVPQLMTSALLVVAPLFMMYVKGCNGFFIWLCYCLLFYLFASLSRHYFRWSQFLLITLFYSFCGWSQEKTGLMGIPIATSVLMFLILEVVMSHYDRMYRRYEGQLQDEILQHQFSEIRNIYMNMRGWRHDYHNHMQVLKAYLDHGQSGEAREYLGQIEHELNKVDTFVKSGNMMADAILNSKLTMAMEQKIQVTCDAYLPQELFLTDVDLCTILGNLLDNAIEGCGMLPEDKRFLRIYLAMVKQQFYLSIQNSSQEIMGVSQKNYITTKRGNHGLGLKRVSMAVQKWNGFLNVNQEPGVFAVEVSIPEG